MNPDLFIFQISIVAVIATLAFFIGAAVRNYRKQILSYKEKIKLLSDTIETLKEKSSHSSAPTTEEKLRYREENDFIFRLSENISLIRQRAKIAKKIVNEIQKFLYVHRVVLLLVDKETNALCVEHSCGINDGYINNFSLTGSENISRFVMRRGSALLINDLASEDYLKRINREPYLTKSFICVPLILHDEAIGIIHICDRKNEKPFNQHDLLLVENIGRVSAIAFKNRDLDDQIKQDYLNTITALASAIDARDPYTRCHSENVTRYSVALAHEVKCSRSRIDILRQAALLHDIGKIGIRDNILLKKGKLTDEEYEQIKLHVVKGAEIVSSLEFLKDAARLIRHHHERFDGKGYPDKIAGEQIELGARIMAVADSFDAMTSDRPYRKALPLPVAAGEITKCKGTQFDPELAEAFLRILKRDPGIVCHPLSK